MKTYLPRAPIRMLAFAVIFAMLASLLPAIPQEASAATRPSSPRLGDSKVTWDCVYFGNYPQGANGESEKIKWRVLSVNGDEALLLADKNLDCKKYNETYTKVTWETSTIRSWLNGYGAGSNKAGKNYTSGNFMDTAFTSAEREAIKGKTIQNPDNPIKETAGGNPTTDKVFLLSIDEVTNLDYGFPSDYSKFSETRRALNTEYAKARGASTDSSAEYAGNGRWWLRSPGRDSRNAAQMDSSGYVSHVGLYVSYGKNAVRPALFLNLKSNLWTDAGTVSREGAVSKIQKPKTVTLKKVSSPKKGALKLTWKKDGNASGYQAMVATDKKFKKNKKSAAIKKNKTVTKTFTKLKRNKTYYAKVRAYKKSGSKTVYGAYSKVKKKKVK